MSQMEIRVESLFRRERNVWLSISPEGRKFQEYGVFIYLAKCDSDIM